MYCNIKMTLPDFGLNTQNNMINKKAIIIAFPSFKS